MGMEVTWALRARLGSGTSMAWRATVGVGGGEKKQWDPWLRNTAGKRVPYEPGATLKVLLLLLTLIVPFCGCAESLPTHCPHGVAKCCGLGSVSCASLQDVH